METNGNRRKTGKKSAAEGENRRRRERKSDMKLCKKTKVLLCIALALILLGSALADGDRVVIIEDVTTAGTSIKETLPIIKAQADVKIIGMCVSVDRQERGAGEKSAFAEIEEEFGFPVIPIVTMSEVVEYLSETPVDGRMVIDDAVKDAIDGYYERYGVR